MTAKELGEKAVFVQLLGQLLLEDLEDLQGLKANSELHRCVSDSSRKFKESD